MAETYETSIYKTQPAAPVPQTQTQTAAPVPQTQTTGNEQYQTPIYKTPQTAPPPPAATGGAAQPSGWMPQSARDWIALAAQNSLMGLYPGLTAQADAARKRLDPVTAASADVAGNILSPTTALNAVPFVGPELAGGVHEGIKSAVENWKPDESWGAICEECRRGCARSARRRA